jgi:endonuclease/exonuclease/phosphatase family metal-dependent hydrolase
MRIVSWNCNMGFEKKQDALLRFEPDIVVLQECSVQAVERSSAPFKHWVGSNKHKGLAVLGFAGHKYELDRSYTEEWPWFLPVRVDDVPLHLLGLWACVKDQRLRYVRVMHHAIEHYAEFLTRPQVIVIGDFNSNSRWDARYRERSHSRLVEKLGKLGLVSAYHALRGEEQGQEVTPTQFMYRDLTKSYHLDYAFVSQDLSRSCDLMVGSPSEWLSKSDHMPLILTVSL